MKPIYTIVGHIPFRYGEARRLIGLALTGLKYLTLPKLSNFIKCEVEKRRRQAHLSSRPYIAIIDTTNACNLQCPYCPTGKRRVSGRAVGTIDLELVRRLLDETAPYLISANLFNWGEPLLHPHIANLTALFNQRGIMTSLSSNMSLSKTETLQALCDAGLDYFLVSFSGADQEVYEKYHRTGRLDMVLENVRHLIAYRNKHCRSGPLVEMKYLLFKHNQHQVTQARDLAHQIGVDIFRVVKAGGPAENLVEERQDPREGLETGLCHQLWQAVTVNADGGIPPCCFVYFKTDDFAHLTDKPLHTIRNNDFFTTARMFFAPKQVSTLPPLLKHPCLKCHLVHGQPHLQEYLNTNPNATQSHRTGGY